VDSRTRVSQTLNHREPDRIPFDLAGTGLSTIHVTAYQNLRRYLGLPEIEPEVAFVPEQLVRVDEDLARRLEADVRPALPGTASSFEWVFRDEVDYEAYTDEWASAGACRGWGDSTTICTNILWRVPTRWRK